MRSDHFLRIVDKPDDVWSFPESEFCLSNFSSKPNIGINQIIALLQGRSIADLSDGEYVHWLQLTPDALDFVAKELNSKILPPT